MMRDRIVQAFAVIALASSLLAAATGAPTPQDRRSIVYFIDAYVYRNDTGAVNNISAGYGVESDFPSIETGYYIEMISNDGRILFRRNLGVSFMVFIDPPQAPKALDAASDADRSLVYERLPYAPGAEKIVILHKEAVVLEIDLSKFICNHDSICDPGENEYNCPKDCAASTTTTWTTTTLQETPTSFETRPCGNGACEPEKGENHATCPQDCPSGSRDGYCDKITDDRCDPDCAQGLDVDCRKKPSELETYLPYVAAAAVLLIIVSVVFFIRKRGN